jgi:hypothetical protein
MIAHPGQFFLRSEKIRGAGHFLVLGLKRRALRTTHSVVGTVTTLFILLFSARHTA